MREGLAQLIDPDASRARDGNALGHLQALTRQPQQRRGPEVHVVVDLAPDRLDLCLLRRNIGDEALELLDLSWIRLQPGVPRFELALAATGDVAAQPVL